MPWNAYHGGTAAVHSGLGQPDFILRCGCGHGATLRAKIALQIWGEGVTGRAMARSLVCTRCSHRRSVEMSLHTLHDTSPRDPWGHLRAYPEVTIENVRRKNEFGPMFARQFWRFRDVDFGRENLKGFDWTHGCALKGTMPTDIPSVAKQNSQTLYGHNGGPPLDDD